MTDNQNNDTEPRLSRGMKAFIVAGTVILVGFGLYNLVTHEGASGITRTKIDPDSALADKELVVKQDTARRDTASADSANKEEAVQAEKVFNSIRGNNRHKVDEEEQVENAAQEGAAEGSESSDEAPAEGGKPAAPTIKPQTENAPKVEAVE